MRSDDEQVNEIEDLREQLDAANALLTECYHYQNRLPQDCVQRLRAHLAAQPATAPARDEAECVGCTKHTTWDDCPVHAPARDEEPPRG